jgi:hypothetical protein
MPRKLLLILALAPLAAASPDPDSDMVNERIPVSRVELEAHWGVDCRAAWAEVVRVVAARDCSVLPALRDALRLCTFIYQPPGAAPGPGCPDYAGALRMIEQAAPPDRCLPVAEFTSLQVNCPPPPALEKTQ